MFHIDAISKEPEFAVADEEVVDVGGGEGHKYYEIAN
jgi:hypothetical protein